MIWATKFQNLHAIWRWRVESLLGQWERGEKHPRGASLKLLALIEKKGLDVVA